MFKNFHFSPWLLHKNGKMGLKFFNTKPSFLKLKAILEKKTSFGVETVFFKNCLASVLDIPWKNKKVTVNQVISLVELNYAQLWLFCAQLIYSPLVWVFWLTPTFFICSQHDFCSESWLLKGNRVMEYQFQSYCQWQWARIGTKVI